MQRCDYADYVGEDVGCCVRDRERVVVDFAVVDAVASGYGTVPEIGHRSALK